MEAVQAAEGRPRGARAVLVLEGKLPSTLVPLRNILRVEIYEGVIPNIGPKPGLINLSLHLR
jgi:hypothetical protein